MIEAPKDLEVIWVKPGCEWTKEEDECVQDWLNSEPQLTQLRVFALRHLTAGSPWQDAEDAWGDFNARGLKGVVKSFDPGEAQSGFPGYLFVCFKRFIWKRRKPLPVSEPRPNQDDDAIELIASTESTPLQIAQLRDRLEQVNRGLNALPSKFRTVLTLHYLDGYSCTAIAEKLNISINLVKVRLFRARQILKEILIKESVML